MKPNQVASLGLSFFLTVGALADQASDFEDIVSKCQSAMAARPLTEVSRNEKQQLWIKRLYAPSVVVYDVLRTNSLITPLSGYIEVTETGTFKTADSEEAASTASLSVDDISGPALRYITRVDYVHQAGAWKASSVKRWTVFRPAGRTSFDDKGPSTVHYSRENLPIWSGPIASCVQK